MFLRRSLARAIIKYMYVIFFFGTFGGGACVCVCVCVCVGVCVYVLVLLFMCVCAQTAMITSSLFQIGNACVLTRLRVYRSMCVRVCGCVGWACVTVHVSVCLCIYVCPFLHECLDTLLFLDKFCVCLSHRWRKWDLAPPPSSSVQ